MDITQTEYGLFKTAIDGHSYEFAKWGANLSLETLMDLSAVLGKPLSALLTATGGKTDVELSADALDVTMDALSAALCGQSDRVKTTITKLCTREMFCDGKPVGNFDQHYKGRLGHMFSVARANLQVQYGDFLSELGINAKNISVKVAPSTPPSSSPTVLQPVPMPA